MTAAEVRALTGEPTVDPVIARMIGVEIAERNVHQRYWTDAEILAAIRRQYRATGNAPARWRRATTTHRPTTIYVASLTCFGGCGSPRADSESAARAQQRARARDRGRAPAPPRRSPGRSRWC